jgi:hypothetical protein
VAIYALFHGYFDRGTFEIKSAQWLTSKEVAFVAKRADHQAMNNDEYFVLIGDHLFSPTEIRHAYYGDGVIFRAISDCLTLRWADSHDLQVACGDGSIIPSYIAVQKYKSGDVSISYLNIPNKTTEENSRPK